MKTKKKLRKPTVFGGWGTDAEFQKMTFKEFYEWSGGRLATALFKGELSDELYSIIGMAQARGMKQQWEEEHLPKKNE